MYKYFSFLHLASFLRLGRYYRSLVLDDSVSVRLAYSIKTLRYLNSTSTTVAFAFLKLMGEGGRSGL